MSLQQSNVAENENFSVWKRDVKFVMEKSIPRIFIVVVAQRFIRAIYLHNLTQPKNPYRQTQQLSSILSDDKCFTWEVHNEFYEVNMRNMFCFFSHFPIFSFTLKFYFLRILCKKKGKFSFYNAFPEFIDYISDCS
jgi:hypothetical protein